MSFTAGTRRRTESALPLAAMVDILFLLLIFFMTINAYREHDQRIDVSLPTTETGNIDASPTQIIVSVTDRNEIFIGETQYTPDELQQTLTRLAAQFPDESVVIRGDRASRLETSVTVMDIAYAASLKNVYIATADAP